MKDNSPTNFSLVRRGGAQNDPTNSMSSQTKKTVLFQSSISEFTQQSSIEDTNNEGVSTSNASLSSLSQIERNPNTVLLADDEAFVKSLPDKRSYRAIKLENGSDALLVSDPHTDVEAGAVHVKAGHFNDPDDRAGLAHFHEHMLFLGTEKFPNESDFENYLSQNGGSANAYTAMEDTNYYFSVAPMNNIDSEGKEDDYKTNDGIKEHKTSQALVGALERFSQFFISPNFREDATERELRAIDSEYSNGISSDSWRMYQLLKSSCNPSHPFAKFGCGNYQTLTNGGDMKGSSAEETGGSSPRNELLKFWDKYYQAGNMKLVVVGKAPLDALQRTVEDTFGNVREGILVEDDIIDGKTAAVSNDNLFTSENKRGIAAFSRDKLGIIKEVIPVIEQRQIKLLFATPPSDDPLLEISKPYSVISHLLGHESPGSLHSLLNDEGLINSLTTGTGVDTSDFSLFSISVSLTPEGMKQRDRVLHLLFQWIDLIKSAVHDSENGLMEKYHDELRKMSENSFKFRENGDPTGFASNAAELLFHHEAFKILSGPSEMGKYDVDVAKAYVDRFRPDNGLIIIIDSDLGRGNNDNSATVFLPRTSANSAPWQTEKWYKAQYRQIPMPELLMKEWEFPGDIDPRLKLPKLNEFIPSDFSLRCNDPYADVASEPFLPPKLLINNSYMRLWHKMDSTFKVPKTFIRFHITSPVTYSSPRTMTLCRLFQKVLNDDLNSFVYDASVAGCNYHVEVAPNGFRVALSGYSEKLPILIENLTSRMLSIIEEMKEGDSVRPSLALKFRKAHENLLRQTKNYKLDSPHEVANYNSRILIEEKAWHVDSYIAEMEGVYAEKTPLAMRECAQIAEKCFMGRIKAELLCMGNINEKEAHNVVDIINSRFLNQALPLAEDETPSFRSLKLPTKDEASLIFGHDMSTANIPVIYEEVAFSEHEENNAIEIILQTGCDHTLGLEGIAILELIGYMAYDSAFAQLRTKEQLGYIVSAFTRRTAGGARGFGIVVQSSSTLPAQLEERSEAWLETYRKELEEMSEEDIAMEAAAVVAQLLERDTKLAEEFSRHWGEITATDEMYGKAREPEFDRVKMVARALTLVENEEDPDEKVKRKTAKKMKQDMLEFYDKYFLKTSRHRRAMSARVYGYSSKIEMEKNIGKPGHFSTHADIRRLKQYLSSWPTVPYWSKKF